MISIPGKIPIRIDPFFWFIAIIIGWMNTQTVLGTLIWIFIILVSVVIHEYGHALTALYFGQKPQIELVGFGGLTVRQGPKLKMWQEFIIVCNGPIAGFILSGAAFLASESLKHSGSISPLVYILTVTYYVNFFWTFVNLLPIQPLDGGRLLSIILESIFGLKGVKIALFLSIFLSAAIGIFFFAIHAFLAGALFLLLTFESYRSWKNSLTLTDQDQNFILQHLLKEAEKDIRNGHQEEAIQKLKTIREVAKAGVIYISTTQYLAEILAGKGDYQQAYDLLAPISDKLIPDSLRLLHQLAYRNGQWQEAISFGNRSYQSQPGYETALINALCHSVLGQVRPAIGWLQCALRDGLPNLDEILQKKEFDPIRYDPLFQNFSRGLDGGEKGN